MNIKYIVELNETEREFLLDLVSKGVANSRKLKRANILLMADKRIYQDIDIADALSAGISTVYRTKRSFVENGLDADEERSGGARLLNGVEEALLVSIDCSKSPAGRSRWTLQLLADRLIALTDLESVSIETIRSRLKEKEIKPWQKKCGGN